MSALAVSASAVLQRRLAKPLVFAVALAPVGYLLVAVVGNQLGANPAEALVRSTGDWALRMLCIVLVLTPLRVIVGITALARFRRMLGLFVYFYALLHLLCYSGFDMGFDVTDIATDIAKRPFILVGFSAFLMLTALAITSFNRVIKWMGAKRWQRLHRLVYAVALLAVLHFFWMRAGKQDFAEVWLYGSVLGLALLWRVFRQIKRAKPD
jgi:sulfoxide reductase heme-binding subunit YedZ